MGIFLATRKIFPVNCTGIVIAGYGKDENFPSIFSIEVDGIVRNVMKYEITYDISVMKDFSAAIIPFAQKDVIYSFIEGIAPENLEYLLGYLEKYLDDYSKIILDNIPLKRGIDKDKLLENLNNLNKDSFNNFKNKFQNNRQEKFIEPIVSVVGALPKDELGIMAETLINLTSFKRKYSLQAETVGGPIDVAVISKSDGFIWLKKKSYIDRNLNSIS